MGHPRRWAAGLLLVGGLTLAACGGGKGSPITTPTVGGGATSPTAISSPVATVSPVESPSPIASPTGSPTAAATDLATAFANLEQQGSYSMRVALQGFPDAAALLPGANGGLTLEIDRSGDDRHVRILDTSGKRLAELWRVGGRTWVDPGTGPIEATENTPIVGQLLPFLDAQQFIVSMLGSQTANYTVTGTETVNGVDAVVERATYQVTPPSGAPLMANQTATVDSTLWVARDAGYLVRAQMTITPTAGTPTTTTGPAQVGIDVTNVGQPITIQPPA